MPTLSHLAVLWDATIGVVQFRATELAAGTAKLTLQSLPIRRVEDVKDGFDEAARKQVDGMVVLSSPLILNQRTQIADLALKARLPTISLFNFYPRVGGLMAYGPNWRRCLRRRLVTSVEFSRVQNQASCRSSGQASSSY